MIQYDLIVIGAGASGIISAIKSAQNSNKVLLVEKLSHIGTKIKATGSGKCNITNTLSNEQFMSRFGKDGRFIRDALYNFDSKALIKFLKIIGVDTISKDGFRVFPKSHNSSTILEAFKNQISKLNIHLLLNSSLTNIEIKEKFIDFIIINDSTKYYAKKYILSTGGLGYPILGTSGDGHKFAKNIGHKITTLSPAMMPLFTKELWTSQCTANTIANATIKINLKKYKKYKATGDLIFTKKGLRGPVVLDFAREITPLLQEFNEVPILINLVQGKNEEEIRTKLSKENNLLNLIPQSLINILYDKLKISLNTKYNKLSGIQKDKIIKLLVAMPLTIIGHDGFKMAMITRGGISLKQIDPKTMKSKIIDNLYFCGEIIDIDGPCGGFNLQWSFSSGYLAGELK